MDDVVPPVQMSLLTDGPTVRWGVLGAGGIARDFVDAVRTFTGQPVHAVAARSSARAAEFAASTGVDRAYGAYDELLADPAVDIVYVAVTNNAHLDVALRCIAAGKHVLVEKPLGCSARQARRIADAAHAAGVFAAEAMWTRYLPHVRAVHALIDAGVLGELRWLEASVGGWNPYDLASRLFDPSVGGGALLDTGVYPLAFAVDLLGGPDRLHASGLLTAEGVDAHCAMLLEYPAATAALTTSIISPLPNSAAIGGERGRLEIEPMFLAPASFTVYPVDGEPWRWEEPTGMVWRDGLAWQAAEIARYIHDGRTESPLIPLAESVAVAALVDDASAQLRVMDRRWPVPEAQEPAAADGDTEAPGPA